MKLLFSKKPQAFFYPILLGIFSILFLLIQFILITPIKNESSFTLKFDWPDEVANYFWVRELDTHHRLIIPEPLNFFADNQIHPRSFNTNSYGALVPGSFLGLIILFGILAKIFGLVSVIYFTPFLMLGAVWAFYFLIKKVFCSEKIAFLSSSLLLASAPWQYYSFESLLPNVPFFSLFLVATSLFVYAGRNRRWLWFLAAFFSGLALSIRPSELVWVSVVWVVILIAKRKELKILDFAWMGIAGFIALWPSMIFQQMTYGSLIVSGYDKLPELAQQSNYFVRLLKQAFLPFGFHPLLALRNFWHYFVTISPLNSILFFGGLIIFWRDKNKFPLGVKIYFWLSVFISLWLFNYYGSWLFEDLRTLSMNRLGASYVRYWLIIFALSFPFVVLMLEKIAEHWKLKYFGGAVVAIMVISNFYQILYTDPNNILAVRKKVANNRQAAIELLKNVPEDALIITNRSDKIFFPERQVIETYGMKGDLTKIIPMLKKAVPVYLHENGVLKIQ